MTKSLKVMMEYGMISFVQYLKGINVTIEFFFI